MSLSKLELEERLAQLYPIFAAAAVGDFDVEVEISDEDDELAPVWVGVKLMIDTIKEKLADLEIAQSRISKANEALIEYNEYLLRTSEKSQTVSAKYKQLVSIIMHDLKSPVGNLIQLIELKKQGNHIVDETDQMIQECARQLQSILALMKDQLSGRSNANRIDQNEFHAMWESVRAEFSIMLKNINHSISFTVNEPLSFEYPKMELISLLSNLLSNAIKYRSTNRKLEINVKVKQLDSDNVMIEFTDNGSGIDLKKNGERLFNQKVRLDSSSEGSGIGLFLTKLAIESHGGEVQVKSQVGKGTTFRFLLKNLQFQV